MFFLYLVKKKIKPWAARPKAWHFSLFFFFDFFLTSTFIIGFYYFIVVVVVFIIQYFIGFE
jgi:hypothetical protein